MDAVFFASPDGFRAWPAEHRECAAELWVGFYKTATGRPSITWPQAVDEALCFGWIDGVRKPGSIWSQVNIRRAEELTALGRMRTAGLEAFATRDGEKTRPYSYENERGRSIQLTRRSSAPTPSLGGSSRRRRRHTARWRASG